MKIIVHLFSMLHTVFGLEGQFLFLTCSLSCGSRPTFSDGEAQNVKQSYVKNGHTLPVSGGGGVISSGRSPGNQVKLPGESDFRMHPGRLAQPEDHRGRSPSDKDRRGALCSRGTGLHEEVWRSGGVGAHVHGEGEWKSNLAWQGQSHAQKDEGRRGGRLHPNDGQRRPGLQKAPSEDGRRRPAEAEWKPTLPRHASAEEGRTRRGKAPPTLKICSQNMSCCCESQR